MKHCWQLPMKCSSCKENIQNNKYQLLASWANCSCSFKVSMYYSIASGPKYNCFSKLPTHTVTTPDFWGGLWVIEQTMLIYQNIYLYGDLPFYISSTWHVVFVIHNYFYSHYNYMINYIIIIILNKQTILIYLWYYKCLVCNNL